MKIMRTTKLEDLEKICKLIRYWILKMTTEAGSGHATSSLSAVELMVALMFSGFFKFEIRNPKFENNDRLIFSKGHASPLFYALWAAARSQDQTIAVPDEKDLMSYRKFGSDLEGHPTQRFPYTEASTGSLGQGLSIGVGMAMASSKFKVQSSKFRTFVLLGDSEMAEGSNWEAIQLASYYKLDNLMGIVDVNRLGQRGETMYGYDVIQYKKRLKAFGWQTYTVDGHNLEQILDVYKAAFRINKRPTMIIAKTVKGKGVSFLEDRKGWHGRALFPAELDKALAEIGQVDTSIRGTIQKPEKAQVQKLKLKTQSYSLKVENQNTEYRIQNSEEKLETGNYQLGNLVATREAYGEALKMLAGKYPELMVLDAEVSNSTYAEKMKEAAPKRFFEMFIAEQNMVGTALGLSLRGKIPMVSTFAAFFSRAFDQIRMSQYSNANIKFVGSHAGVSIGEDGSSQMGLEDLAIFRTLHNSVVLYPSDAVSTVKLVEEAVKHQGNVYIRITRGKTAVIYSHEESFVIGGSKTLKENPDDVVTLVGGGVTLHECLKAAEILEKEGVKARVIDLYSIKPLDVETLRKAAEETKAIVMVEDHYPEGGIGEAVAAVLASLDYKVTIAQYHITAESQKRNDVNFVSLAVRKLPRSGKPEELLGYEEIDTEAIVKTVKGMLNLNSN
jgi:transketolase